MTVNFMARITWRRTALEGTALWIIGRCRAGVAIRNLLGVLTCASPID